MDSRGLPPPARRRATGLLVAANVVYALVLIVLAYLPHIPTLAGIRVPDVVAHAVAYGLQALLLLLLLVRVASPAVAAIGACCGAGLFGGLTELVQFLQPTRSPAVGDLGADVAGAVVAVALGLAAMARPRSRARVP